MLVWNYDCESYDATYNENLVNKMFIGHMKIGGAEALAGLGVTTPVILFLSAFFLTIWRKIVLLIPLIFLLPQIVPNPTIGVFLAEPIADFVAVCTTGMLFYR